MSVVVVGSIALVVVLLVFVFVVPILKLAITRRCRLRVAGEQIQPFVKASREKFSQTLQTETPTRITVLIENQKDQDLTGLVAEHGLSLHIERNGKDFLFDTGSTGAAVDNARKMGIDLRNVEAVVISHGHKDHGGGLEAFFEVNDRAPVYMGKEAVVERYAPLSWYYKIPIGLDKAFLDANRGNE